MAWSSVGRKRPIQDLDFQLSCPCCYRPGNPFCGICEPADSAKYLEGLRSLMKAHEIDAYLVGSEDAHGSEYVHPADMRRAFLTGFSGSAGIALVTASEALLWTDARYFLEAEESIKGTSWVLMRQYQPGVPELWEWALANLDGKVLGFDPALMSAETFQDWTSKWGSRVATKRVLTNLVDAMWSARPDDPCQSVEVHPLKYAGEGVTDKLQRVRTAIKEKDAAAIIVSALDQIAWLFNLRGSDVEFNPVFFSYAVVTEDKALIYLRALSDDREGLRSETRAHLEDAGVVLQPYEHFFSSVKPVLQDKKVLVTLSSCSVAILDLVPPELRVIAESPLESFKAAKNAQEINGLREACHRDSIALCGFLASLESRIATPGEKPFSEVDASDLIVEFRRKQALYVGDSFQTISSAGANSAKIHYRPASGNCALLDAEKIYLVDTGAQYKDGTTDVTRTVHFGVPTSEQRRCFTRVLQGHIALASAIFPEGTPGLMLDTLARQPLWRDGLNYGHGTSHGIGAYLNCHEGPIGIGGGTVPGSTIQRNERMKRIYLAPIQAGNYISDEPGFYKDGEFGIRLESDLVVVPAETRWKTGGRNWLKFEYLTLVPFCRTLLDIPLLSLEEVRWLDAYHNRVWDTLAGSLEGAALDWLRKNTQPLSASS